MIRKRQAEREADPKSGQLLKDKGMKIRYLYSIQRNRTKRSGDISIPYLY
jgi:hypothetical protein